MFKVIEIKSYNQGYDHCTDYFIKCDEVLNIDEVVEKLQNLGHDPSGFAKLKKEKNVIILKTVMF